MQTADTRRDAGSDGQAFSMYRGGPTIAYGVLENSYTLTQPGGGISVIFGPADAFSGPSGSGWTKTTGTRTDSFTFAETGGIALSYTQFSTWRTTDAANGVDVTWTMVGGSATLGTDMPSSGTATYQTQIHGGAVKNGTSYDLASASTATLSVDFGLASVSSTLDLAGNEAGTGNMLSFGSFSGSGPIETGGPGFAGDMAGTGGGGVFSGAFFGPQAAEAGYVFYLDGTDFHANGYVGAIKN